MTERVVAADLVVVGGGIAGLTVALEAAPRRVALVAKAPLGTGSASVWAQGGIAAAIGADDSAALHAADTEAVGAGLVDRQRASDLTSGAAAAIEGLIAAGVRFDRDALGALALGREAAHSRARILHANGDATGREVVRALTAAVLEAPHIEVLDDLFVDQLLASDGRIAGVGGRRRAGGRVIATADAVVLATGGIGQLWRWTTNPREATGDGLALAARAGAVLRDLEMVQFHPTALAVEADPLPLLTEAIRGEGAVLLDSSGIRFMPAEHPLAELAPRDVVARAIAHRLALGETVVLDAREAIGARFPERFPSVFARCLEAGIDPRFDPLPVVPACHYHMGGIATDGDGRTNLPGLFAVGEVASTGVHGANRLASSSLLEGAVVGRRVASVTAGERRAGGQLELAAQLGLADRVAVEVAWDAPHPLRRRLRQAAWRALGLERDESGLSRFLDELETWREPAERHGGEVSSLWTIATVIAEAAFARRESRGAHRRKDHPDQGPAALPSFRRFEAGTGRRLASAAAAEAGR